MTDRVHASAAHASPTTVPPPSQFTRQKPHLNPPYRHPYRPIPAYRASHNRRSCSSCRCCCYTLLLLLIFLLLSATALYFLYNPKPPTFSLSSLKISQLNLTTTPPDDSTKLTTMINFTLTSINPNNKLLFLYDPFSIKLYSLNILIANGSFPNFISNENNVTIVHTTLSMNNQLLDDDSANALRHELKRKNGVFITLVAETKVKVVVEKIKVKKFDIVVTCQGIHGQLPKGKLAGSAVITNTKCKVDRRFKLWKLTFLF